MSDSYHKKRELQIYIIIELLLMYLYKTFLEACFYFTSCPDLNKIHSI